MAFSFASLAAAAAAFAAAAPSSLVALGGPAPAGSSRDSAATATTCGYISAVSLV